MFVLGSPWALVPGDADTLAIPEEAFATVARRMAVESAGWSNGGLLASGLGAETALAFLPLFV